MKHSAMAIGLILTQLIFGTTAQAPKRQMEWKQPGPLVRELADGGDWTFLGSPPDTGIGGFLIDPRNDNLLYVGADRIINQVQCGYNTEPGGLYITRDGGSTWVKVLSGRVRGLAMDPEEPNRVYVAVHSWLGTDFYRSEDRGLSWAKVSLIPDYFTGLTISPRDARVLYAGTYWGGGIYRSKDGGESWEFLSFGGGYYNTWDVQEDPATGTLYASAEITPLPHPYDPPLFQSLDGGRSWRDISGTLPWHVVRMQIHPSNSWVYALTEGAGLYISKDTGATWQLLNDSFGLELLMDKQDPQTLFGGDAFCGRRGGAFISTDGGVSFQAGGLLDLTVGQLALNGSRTRLYAGCVASGIYAMPWEQGRSPGRATIDMETKAGGTGSAATVGKSDQTQSGYAAVAVTSGTVPYGTAVYRFRQNGTTISEAGVPASPPTVSARVFIDYRSSVAAVPGRADAGTIDTDTGIAVVNSGPGTANVTYTLRDAAGASLSTGHGTLDAGAHFARFIWQLKDLAPDFVLPPDFQTRIQFGSLEISSDRALSVLALRMTTNQREEALLTTLPTADLTQPPGSAPVYFPQFADGGGYTTTVILLNTSNADEVGAMQILDDQGNPLVATMVDGVRGSTFRYRVPPGGAFRFQTDGSPIDPRVGWVRLIPNVGFSSPIGAGIFSYNPGNVLVTESGIPAAVSTTHARVYVDLSEGHNTGLAIANPARTDASIAIKALHSDGVTMVGTSQGPLALPVNGHRAMFSSELVTGLPDGFTGVLDVSSATPFVALTVRSLLNERTEFLLATFPVADATRAAPSPIVFPQIADGGGYMTQFIFINPGGGSTTTLNLYDESGRLLPVGK